jgi:hypothetical protein
MINKTDLENLLPTMLNEASYKEQIGILRAIVVGVTNSDVCVSRLGNLALTAYSANQGNLQ